MKKFLVDEKTPVSSICYNEPDTGDMVTKQLFPTTSITLPEEDPQVKILIALGHIKEQEVEINNNKKTPVRSLSTDQGDKAAPTQA